ncbi:MAG: S-methyl-5-thioribose-1-phosphate isomerase [bacterium]
MEPIRWTDQGVRILDQTLLPATLRYITCTNYQEVADAIRSMRVRGAPAIGIAAAMGVAWGALGMKTDEQARFFSGLEKICNVLLATRPTAVNLAWAIKRMKGVAHGHEDAAVSEIKGLLREEAERILQEDVRMNRRIGSHGEALVGDGHRILTHCNAGALATGGYGTALGIIRAAWEKKKRIHVLVDETRPALQGARLTAWELLQEGIPFTLITDNMAGDCMRRGMVDMVLVGADRITARGDVANKIGTYSLAVLANAHGIPFYVAAPSSTVDLALSSGDEIPIEERTPDEVILLNGSRIAPEGVAVFNPSFDVTPHHLVSAIITEHGVIRPPFSESIGEVFSPGGKSDGA